MILDMSKVHTPDGVQPDVLYTMVSVDAMGRIEVVHEDVKYKSHTDGPINFLDRMFQFECKEDDGMIGFGIQLNHSTGSSRKMLILQEKKSINIKK